MYSLVPGQLKSRYIKNALLMKSGRYSVITMNSYYTILTRIVRTSSEKKPAEFFSDGLIHKHTVVPQYFKLG